MSIPRLILASGSTYRAAQLTQLGVPFEQVTPDVDESPEAAESPTDLAVRLALDKAKAAVNQVDGDFLLVASDQVCHLDDEIFHKPITVARAEANLARFSGQWVSFTSGLVVTDGHDFDQWTAETFELRFKHLTPDQIEHYVALDQPLDCAGAIKIERAGATLVKEMRGRDFNSLIGLPIIALTELLARFDRDIFDFR